MLMEVGLPSPLTAEIWLFEAPRGGPITVSPEAIS
jgi:hypothetical protein